MALQLDLNKSQQKLVLSLQKAGISTPPSVDLAFVLDVSGSFEDEHVGGVTNALMTRLVPWGMTFDPDKKLDVFTFSHGPRHAHYVGEVTATNHSQYVERNIIGRVPGWKGGTDYSYVIEKVLAHFGWLGSSSASASPGFFQRIFGGAALPVAMPPSASKRRSLVVFVTDGDNSDKDRTEEVLAKSQASGDLAYFLFLGVSNQGGAFPFLRKIADRFDNTAVVIVSDIRGFVALSDEELNDQMLGAELVRWLSR